MTINFFVFSLRDFKLLVVQDDVKLAGNVASLGSWVKGSKFMYFHEAVVYYFAKGKMLILARATRETGFAVRASIFKGMLKSYESFLMYLLSSFEGI